LSIALLLAARVSLCKNQKTSNRRIAIKLNIYHLLSLEYMIILVFAQADVWHYETVGFSERVFIHRGKSWSENRSLANHWTPTVLYCLL